MFQLCIDRHLTNAQKDVHEVCMIVSCATISCIDHTYLTHYELIKNCHSHI